MVGIKVSGKGKPTEEAPVPIRPLCVRSELVAHTPASAAGGWHLLGDHLRGVGDLASEFAAPFGGEAMAGLAGYLHDAGKAVDEVQRRFRVIGFQDGPRRERLGVPHKVEGALLMASLLDHKHRALALAGYLMNFGHHSGIPAQTDPATITNLLRAHHRPEETVPLLNAVKTLVGRDFDSLVRACTLPDHVASSIEDGDLRGLELFTRMCHSALVDADFLDTSAHFAGRLEPWRSKLHGMPAWLERFKSHYSMRFRDAPPTELNQVRGRVLDACVAAAHRDLPAGIYRLPAPTGTGKTMAAAAFALHHAVRFDKQRVIVAVPFTTITTQNAAAYRDAFGDLAPSLLEHHSNIVDDELADGTWQRLSAPGWDAEFIVTTTVQLFESLFSNRPSHTRKLHRIAGSVIVLDEVQALPLDLLEPILGMLRELVEHYGVTVLLASATQPTFWALPVWRGLPVHDIIPVDSVPDVTQRVKYEVRSEPQSWEMLAAEVADEPQVLMIENRRADADALYQALAQSRGGDGTLLLSKSMTADHRERVLATVRALLMSKEPVALVSTQLIEAGVDVDFPVVFRALGPAEAVVQAAGRCNREGRLGVRGGRVVVHVPSDGGTPPGVYSAQTGIARDRFVSRTDSASFDSATDLAGYFDEVYRSTQPQRREKETALRGHRITLNFPALAREFRMIEETSFDVVVLDHPVAEVAAAISRAVEDLIARPMEPISRARRQLLQRHSAAISHRDVALTTELPQGVRVWCGAYDPKRGVVTDHSVVW